ncbi:ASKHA domain-containing protein [Desulfopila inferna]|uniref:ASKHA domain-containing protein n=1 Tax=Desulfopila inferna TaxID=468528 RepID=UPI00196627BC|nr:ASKHA domain-containing protein [Desulfopila inferna]MBM9602801.1 DUF4445 domain-containing protein [Desulfopila inferna]
MQKCVVKFLPHEREIEVEAGTNLIRVAMDAGIHINASCGGEGVCGKCRVVREDGELEGGITERISQEDVEKGYRLACLSTVVEDVTIIVPVESAVDSSILNMQAAPRSTAATQHMDIESLKEQGLFINPVKKTFLEIPPPTKDDNLSDVGRLVRSLKEKADWHKLELTVPVIRKLPEILRENDFKVTATLVRPVRDNGKTRITNIQSGDTTAENFAIAVDIGTTTIYGQLVNLQTGKVLAENGLFNGQISYGEDVISRIIVAEKPEGLKKLQKVVVATINEILDNIFNESGIDRENISTITIAGNTTMTQLLLRVNPSYIRRAPYVPAATLYPPFRAETIGIDLNEHAIALLYPQISSYVGGDIVAGIMGSGLYRSEELTIYMDIGTNAEIVIGNKDWLACAACSAGPAFEGGGVEFGMRAAKGAIEDFLIDPVTYEPMILTIGNMRPKGICGSGLITMIAVMFEMGVIDNSGKLNREMKTPRIRQRNDVWEYVISWKDETQIDRDISLSEVDIDNLIRAKAAIYSGCMTLLDEVGLSMDMMEHITLAGGFGSYIDLEKAMTIGLLPEIDPSKVTYLGNGSLLGAKMSSLTNRIRKDVVEVTRKMTNFELSETPSYMDNYVAAMFIPHTDVNKFPKLKQRMEGRKSKLESIRGIAD